MIATHSIARPLVIGGHGFVGCHVVRALLARGLSPRVSHRPGRVPLRLRSLPVTRVPAALDDREALARALSGRDTVFFAAGHYPRYCLDEEREVAIARYETRCVVEAALDAQVARFVLTSSTATIGKAPEGRAARETDVWTAPPSGSVYHAVKLAIEDEVRAGVARGLPAVVVCPGGCLGEEDAKAGTGFFLIALSRGLLRFTVEGPTNVVDVAAVAEAHVRAAEVGAVGSRYILGGENLLVGELLEQSARALGVPLAVTVLPIPTAERLASADELEASRTGRARQFIPREFVDIVRLGQPFDSTRARQELDLQPTDLDLVLGRAIRWFEAHRYIPRRASDTGVERCPPTTSGPT